MRPFSMATVALASGGLPGTANNSPAWRIEKAGGASAAALAAVPADKVTTLAVSAASNGNRINISGALHAGNARQHFTSKESRDNMILYIQSQASACWR